MVEPTLLTSKDDDLLGVANRSDAMGTLAVWSKRGRDLVPHLTEQTTNVRGFQILIEALRLWTLYEPEHEEHAGGLPKFFVLVEQAYARTIGYAYGGDAWQLPGSRSVRALEGEKPHISLTEPRWSLLRSQLGNGIWGLYRGAARRAGLVGEDAVHLSTETLEAAHRTSAFGDAAEHRLFALIERALDGETVPLPTRDDSHLVKSIRKSFDELPLAQHLYDRLVDGHTLNLELARRLHAWSADSQGWRRLFLDAAVEAFPQHRSTLRDVIRCESLLAVVESVFEWLCANKGKRLDAVEHALPVDLAAVRRAQEAFADSGVYGTGTARKRYEWFRDRVVTRDRVGLARSVLGLHEDVSKERGRTAWVWEEQGVLASDVDLKEPSAEMFDVGCAWRNDYYLQPLQLITTQLEEALHG